MRSLLMYIILAVIIAIGITFIWVEYTTKSNMPCPQSEWLYNAYSPLYRDMYVVKTDRALKPTSWYIDTLVHDTVIIISEYKPQ